MTRVGVVLSGCGVMDGSEIYESVLTLLNLDKLGCETHIFAPDMQQRQVVNHLTGKVVTGEQRNVLVEAARIARGHIKAITEANVANLDAVIFPGGFGAAKNLCTFAFDGENCEVQPEVLDFAKAMAKAAKPMGFICIAPALIARIYGPGVRLTIGNDPDTAQKLEAMGARHVNCPVTECVVDEKHKVVTTPAYMLAKSIGEAAIGIEALVKKVVALVG